MKIVILAGGTGSIALQKGLYDALDASFDGVETKVIVNAYDNGLSTGAVRKVMGGQILGPSDVRKNQTTRLKLEDPKSPWNDFLDIRFTIESSAARQFCLDQVDKLDVALKNYAPATSAQSTPLARKVSNTTLVKEAIDEFFQVPVAAKMDYNDFSLANIVYAGFARANGNSLRQAARIMAKLMGINDNVLLNDDTSLFLGAITKSGKRISDEGDIVSWGNTEDPFVDVFFTNAEGYNSAPTLNSESAKAIMAADLIILSSGTQWSSLIPTYASAGFKTAIEASNAKIIMVMNRWPDKDSPGQTASDIIDVLVPKYFPSGCINLITDSSGHEKMRNLDKNALEKVASHSIWDLKTSAESSITKHSPDRLARAIGATYFSEYLKSSHFMFDYDDTLIGRGNKFPLASQYNSRMINTLKYNTGISICTGNSIKAINLRTDTGPIDLNPFMNSASQPLIVFADGGVNKYLYDASINSNSDHSDDGRKTVLVECINPSVKIDTNGEFGSTQIMSTLRDLGIPISKIENRGDVMISIRPVDEEYRPAILNLVSMALKDSNLHVRSAGRTTIEICSAELSKINAVNYVAAQSNGQLITYVGDELDRGNDLPVAILAADRTDIKCLKVKSPVETAFFLKVLSQTLYL